jgi:ribokinase
MTPRVWVVGSLNIDLISAVDRHPAPGETVLGGDLVRRPGGKGANQALGAAAAGAPVTFVGAIGDDDSGRSYVGALCARGVETAVLTVPSRPTGHALIVVDANGENRIVVAQGANAALTPAHVVGELDRISSGDVLLVQLEVPMPTVVAAAQRARAARATVVLNPSPWRPLPHELLAAVDVLVMNEGETQAAGELPASISVCRTLGERGAEWDGIVATADPVRVVDTTGAGDAFAGALAASLALGLAEEDALAAAVEAGGHACTYVGAQPWTL